jgi:hypothetical protein
MKSQRISHRVLKIVGFVQAVVARVSLLTPPRSLTSVPVPVRRRFGPTRGLDSSRRTGWLPLLAGFVLVAAVPAGAGAPALPAGVPDINDPAIRAHFQPMAVANLQDNPDLPVILLVSTTEDQPQALLLGFDARNGKDTWSLTTDPIILIAVLADTTTVPGVYVDIGFADRGKGSGTYAAVDEANVSALPELLKAVPATGKQSKI